MPVNGVTHRRQASKEGSQHCHAQQPAQHLGGLSLVNLEERCCTKQYDLQEACHDEVRVVGLLRTPGPSADLQGATTDEKRTHQHHLDLRRGHEHHRKQCHKGVADEQNQAIEVALWPEALEEKAVAVHQLKSSAGIDARGVLHRGVGGPDQDGHRVADDADDGEPDQCPVLRGVVANNAWVGCHRGASIWIADALEGSENRQGKGDEQGEQQNAVEVEHGVQRHPLAAQPRQAPGHHDEEGPHGARQQLAQELHGGAVSAVDARNTDHVEIEGQKPRELDDLAHGVHPSN
mmetsp:Transcript_21385/g.50881  ORF Transcript_21385/g.50881 Transcript_21385/m.50881 type:complete len:291 (-) Transcript_21385:2298-3170(-)